MDDLVKRLRGRARFCYDRGEIKSPGIMMEAADAIEALQARVAELEARPTLTTWDGGAVIIPSEYDTVRSEARNAALEDAALACDDEADKCDDAVKWGGHPKYIANCKAAAYAIRERAAAIRAMKGE